MCLDGLSIVEIREINMSKSFPSETSWRRWPYMKQVSCRIFPSLWTWWTMHFSVTNSHVDHVDVQLQSVCQTTQSKAGHRDLYSCKQLITCCQWPEPGSEVAHTEEEYRFYYYPLWYSAYNHDNKGSGKLLAIRLRVAFCREGIWSQWLMWLHVL